MKDIKLIEEYKKTKNSKIKEQIFEEYSDLIKMISNKMYSYLSGIMEIDDIYGYAVLGFLDALDKFEVDKNVKFETYATYRIKGKILDEVRKNDFLPRSVRDKQKKIEKAYEQFYTDNDREPTNEELSKKLDITSKELVSWQVSIISGNIRSIDEEISTSDSIYLKDTLVSKNNIEKSVLIKESKKDLIKALDKLSEREKQIVILYYYEELTVKEIADILNISVARVSQIHRKILIFLKDELKDYTDILSIL